MGYFNVRYDDINEFLDVASELDMFIYVERPGGPYRKLWFVLSQDRMVSVHDFTGTPSDIDPVIEKRGVKLIRADYEYVK